MSQANAERASPQPAQPSTSLSYQPQICRVRAARPQDLAEIVSVLITSFYALTPTVPWLNHWLYWVLRIGIQEDIKTRLKLPASQYTCLVATQHPTEQAQSSVVVGTAEISQRPCEVWQWFPPNRAYLSNLAIAPAHRRQGAAQQLLSACENIALDWGFDHIYLHVMSDNAAAQALYHRAGYRCCEVSNPIVSSLGWRPQRLLLVKQISREPIPSLTG
ncbi:MAG: GNAT family N-acetyltransferase [Phormidesmis sp. RL_2_1]|nr:GNAT family N-acetyltransferase [Phormidesmis sp. RL_2_1]